MALLPVRKGPVIGAALAASVLTAFPAAAQETVLNDEQCRSARAVAIATLEKYTGKMSAPLARSFGNFIKTCDLKTNFDTVPGSVDDSAFGEFRLKLIALRTADAGKPNTLAQR